MKLAVRDRQALRRLLVKKLPDRKLFLDALPDLSPYYEKSDGLMFSLAAPNTIGREGMAKPMEKVLGKPIVSLRCLSLSGRNNSPVHTGFHGKGTISSPNWTYGLRAVLVCRYGHLVDGLPTDIRSLADDLLRASLFYRLELALRASLKLSQLDDRLPYLKTLAWQNISSLLWFYLAAALKGDRAAVEEMRPLVLISHMFIPLAAIDARGDHWTFLTY